MAVELPMPLSFIDKQQEIYPRFIIAFDRIFGVKTTASSSTCRF